MSTTPRDSLRSPLGWRVHHWMWPVVWWARRKPRSAFRQWIWNQTDAIKWRATMRRRRYRRNKRRSGWVIACPSGRHSNTGRCNCTKWDA